MALKTLYILEELPDGRRYIGFQNGIYDLQIKTLIPFDSKLFIFSLIPFNFFTEPPKSVNTTDFPKIYNWLKYISRDNQDILNLLIYYLYCIIHSKTNYQIFLEIIGPGGSGKSTFIKLATCLVGMNNVRNTQLSFLENNRFETAALLNKKLIIITDSETYAGNVSVLKAITGEDPLRLEEKNKPVGNPFIIRG
jgi:putative DNA primase/helicase